MIRHVYTLLARRVLVDRAANSMSVIDWVDQIVVENLPEGFAGLAGLAVDFQLISSWTRDDPAVPVVGRARLRLLLPAGQELDGAPFEVNLRETVDVRLIRPFPIHPYKTPGRYWHIVEVETAPDAWQEVARFPVDILRASTKSATTEPTPSEALSSPNRDPSSP